MATLGNSIFTLPAGRHHDGGGLYLDVSGTSQKRTWIARIKVNGNETMRKLGQLPGMTLAGARKAHRDLQTDLDRGIDPRPKKAVVQPVATNDPQLLSNIWSAYVGVRKREKAWTPEHATKTDGQMTKHIAALDIWGRLVPGIKRAEFVYACKTIESREVRQRIYRWLRAAVEHAVDTGVIESTQFGTTLPAEISRPAGDKGTLASEMREIEDLRSLLQRSWHYEAALSVRAVHRVCALSGHRIGAVLAARPEHVDIEARSWTVPRASMKVKTTDAKDVVIKPLSPQLLDVLRQAKVRALATDSAWLFPNANGTAAVTHASVEKHVRRLQGDNPRFSPHSWRSAVMTWALENGWHREVAQAALDHARGTESDRHYDRSQLIPDVAKMLTDWANEVAPL